MTAKSSKHYSLMPEALNIEPPACVALPLVCIALIQLYPCSMFQQKPTNVKNLNLDVKRAEYPVFPGFLWWLKRMLYVLLVPVVVVPLAVMGAQAIITYPTSSRTFWYGLSFLLCAVVSVVLGFWFIKSRTNLAYFEPESQHIRFSSFFGLLKHRYTGEELVRFEVREAQVKRDFSGYSRHHIPGRIRFYFQGKRTETVFTDDLPEGFYKTICSHFSEKGVV